MKHIIIALQCEAKPLISHYKLKGRPHSQAFRIYEKDDMVLTVSGIGKVASAAATAYTQVLFGNRNNNAWLNLGIMGIVPLAKRYWPGKSLTMKRSANGIRH